MAIASVAALHPVGQWARFYRSLGWSTIRVAPRAKAPLGADGFGHAWTTTPHEPHEFAEGDNVGILLGVRSGELVDVDCDCREAAVAACVLLPKTWDFGRPGRPRSHWLYVSKVGGFKLEDPDPSAGKATIVELHSTGRQTVFPGSFWTGANGREPGPFSPEPIAFTASPTGAPTEIRDEELVRLVHAIGISVLIAREALPGKRHDLALAVAGVLARNEWPAELAIKIIGAVARIHPDADDDDMVRMVELTFDRHEGGDEVSGWNKLREHVSGPRFEALRRIIERPDPRPQIWIVPDDVDMLERACRALRERTPDLYLVGDPGMGRCVELTNSGTRDLSTEEIEATLSHEIRWCVNKSVGRGETKTEKAVRVRPPPQVAELLSRGRGDLPRLKGISRMPIVRANGSVHGVPGYDVESGLYVACNPELALRIGSTSDDAVAAATRLLGSTGDAPWAGDDDRLFWLAHVLTVAGRYLIDGPVPAWVYDASQQGSGKSTLAKAASWIPSGIVPLAVACSFTAVDLARYIGPNANAPGIVIDNVHGVVLRSSELESWLTSGEVRYDMKYQHASTRELRAAVAITMNSARTGRDLARRSVRVRLSPRREHAFVRGDLIKALGPHREALAIDALTILRAWVVAGRPHDGVTRLTSFETWSETIGGALSWLGDVGDVVGRIKAAQVELDVDSEGASEVVEAFARWLEATGRTEARARDVIADSGGTSWPARQALIAAAASRRNVQQDKLDAGGLAYVFRASTGWTEFGRLACRESHGGVWRVEK